jgi:2',3'-cyclic-nucleotide 2'-phosphodiesterase (5'-nucleotidase family)
VLSANAIDAASGKLIAEPYIVKAFGDYRVAIVGLSGGATPAGIAVRDPLATAQTIVPEAGRQAHAVILLSHAGPEVDRRIADTVPGIAVIVSGSPGPLQPPWRSAKTDTVIYHADEAQPNHAGRNLGIGRLTLDPQGELAGQTWQRLALGSEIADDPAMAAWVQEQMNK